jgi:hypothetical protein
MIDFQSSTIVGRPNHRPCYSPSSGGLNEQSECRLICCSISNERSECRFVCCSGVGRGEGELSRRGHQSALIKVGRVSPLTAAIPPARITFCPFCQNLCALCASVAKIRVYRCPSVVKKIFLPNEPIFVSGHRRLCEANPTCSRLIQVNPTSSPLPPRYMQRGGSPSKQFNLRDFKTF